MVQTVLKIEGMMCPMCESHINDAIRNHFNVKKVSSSHSKGETIIVSENGLERSALVKTIEETGYQLISLADKPYEQKPKFRLFGRRV